MWHIATPTQYLKHMVVIVILTPNTLENILFQTILQRETFHANLQQLQDFLPSAKQFKIKYLVE